MINKLKDEKVKAVLLATFMSLASIIIILEFTDTNLSWNLIARVQAKFLVLGLVLHMFSWIFYAVRLKLLASLAGAGALTASGVFAATVGSATY